MPHSVAKPAAARAPKTRANRIIPPQRARGSRTGAAPRPGHLGSTKRALKQVALRSMLCEVCPAQFSCPPPAGASDSTAHPLPAIFQLSPTPSHTRSNPTENAATLRHYRPLALSTRSISSALEWMSSLRYADPECVLTVPTEMLSACAASRAVIP